MTEQKKTVVDLDSLSPEQLEQLQAQLRAKQEAERAKQEADLQAAKALEWEAVDNLVEEAQRIANNIGAFKSEALKRFTPLINLKEEVGKASANQQSYTFHSQCKKRKITIRYNQVWKCDDGIHVCINLAKQWLGQLASVSEESAVVVNVLEKLISSRDGATYSTEGIWELIEAANSVDNELLQRAAEAGRKSLYKEPSSVSVQVYVHGETGWEQLPLSATKA